MPIADKHIAFNTLFNRYYAGLCAYCDSFINDRDTAEDLVQDVFVNVWMQSANLNFDESIGSYLYRAAHNACIGHLRHQKVQEHYNAQMKAKLAEAEWIPAEWVIMDADPVEESEIQTLYRKTLERLPLQTREIFLNSREKGMKYAEIAELLSLSVKIR
ncbi:MAG: RNA polymerase sigma-70 factor [Tannerella sp.]|jgi:RNA polymerase sigma-70 factor (ECF subfamily)|nr:RNA polymerase sigma-70 factor [Tannerella sp.]